MSKTIRNTVFTIVMLGLTTVGLSWNKKVAQQHNPVSLGKVVLASQSPTDTQDEQTFPLSINFDRPIVKLGQSQQVTIKTVPNATLDIVTLYPDQTFDHPQTFQANADENGSYNFRFRLNDFKYIGSFQVSVVATSGNRSSETKDTFVLQPWVKDADPVDADSRYLHPLIP